MKWPQFLSLLNSLARFQDDMSSFVGQEKAARFPPAALKCSFQGQTSPGASGRGFAGRGRLRQRASDWSPSGLRSRKHVSFRSSLSGFERW